MKKRNKQALQRAIYWSRLNNSRFAKFSSYSWPVFCQRRNVLVLIKMKFLILALTTVVAICSVNCDVYFDEKFPDGKFYKCSLTSPVFRHFAYYRFLRKPAGVSIVGLIIVFSLQIHGNPIGFIVNTPVKNSANSSWRPANSTMTQRKIKVRHLYYFHISIWLKCIKIYLV